MDNDYKILEIIHLHKNTNQKIGITLDINKYEFLKDLYNQYGKFSIDKSDNDEIKLITK